jgi:hypothetical protein
VIFGAIRTAGRISKSTIIDPSRTEAMEIRLLVMPRRRAIFAMKLSAKKKLIDCSIFMVTATKGTCTNL